MIQTGAVIRRRVVARGRVQGVFFRDTCRRQAWSHRVSGWVTNREDGAVEAVFEGDAAAVQAMVEWARRGPAQAHVAKLEVIEEEPRGELGFSIR
jgi:acylphosphatase